MASSILLQGGTVLIHGSKDHVHAIKADLLIQGNLISKIEPHISVTDDTQVIDCKNKILTPGFIDTHHHVWQTLLKGRHGDEMLLDYFPTGNFTSGLHKDEDFFWGTLGGCLAMLDAGTTTVVDHAHLNYTPQSSKAAIAATVSSGFRSIFCYCPTPLTTSFHPFQFTGDVLKPWVLETLRELASKQPFGNGRVGLGLAFDGWYLPKEVVVKLMNDVKEMGVKLVTTHYVRNALLGNTSPIELLSTYNLLDSSYLFSHATNMTSKDASLLLSTNSHVSTTPSTELQMLGGATAAFHPSFPVTSQCGLGVDCHSNQSVSLISEARILLQHSRAVYNQTFIDAGKTNKCVNWKVEDVFNLATIGGARAAGMEKEIGSLEVGKKADILIWDTLSPAMVCAAQEDPVSAVVLQSSPKDIEIVIVDGIIRKEKGVLKNVDLRAGREIWGGDGWEEEEVDWEGVAGELVRRRERVQGEVEKVDFKAAREAVIKGWHIDESVLVDSL